MFYDWINEMTEDMILEKYNEAPGVFRSRLAIADWLLYSMEELARFVKNEDIPEIKKLRIRMQYGVREELLKLVMIKGIGRVRARKLFRAGIKTISDLKKVPVEKLAKIIGKKTAEKIRQSL